MKRKDPNRYPKGWNRKRMESLATHYEGQSDKAAITEAEAAYRRRTTSLVEVPVRLLPKVRRLLAEGAA